MAHLLETRKGWQNEHLGLFILSRFAFCANPVTVSDDLGSDLFCCLFETASNRTIRPLNSFAIQIKSSNRRFDVSNKIDYLSKLELPFFIGVVDQKTLELHVYSGEYLPMLFSEVGVNLSRLRIVPTNRKVSIQKYYGRFGEDKIRVFFPRVARISADTPPQALRSVVKDLHSLCRRIHRNIATRLADEHVYEIPTHRRFYMLAGPGSAKTFRGNLYKRLAETCFNFAWLIRSPHHLVTGSEIEIYLSFLKSLRRRHRSFPPYLNRGERELRKALKDKAP